MKGETEDTRKVQMTLLEMKSTIFEMKNIPCGIKSKSDYRGKAQGIENMTIETVQRKKIRGKKKSFSYLLDNMY